MFDLFRRRRAARTPQPAAPARAVHQPTAPGTEIHYHPELIGQLTADHHKLLAIHDDIARALAMRDFPRISGKLEELRSGLTGHLLTENVRLYIYLDRWLAGDETNSDLIRSFRRDMDAIGRHVMKFLNKYQTTGVDAELATAFSRDFAAIGTVLAERIRKEEEVLYPLYLPRY
ncbi:MAG: hemerythrin domain-containing protein [Betaproteobacteria bacterium]|nr:hemerythrin domain-containing protein [Betaproteobacteria bacterium]